MSVLSHKVGDLHDSGLVWLLLRRNRQITDRATRQIMTTYDVIVIKTTRDKWLYTIILSVTIYSAVSLSSDLGASLRGGGHWVMPPPSDVSQSISYRPNYGNF